MLRSNPAPPLGSDDLAAAPLDPKNLEPLPRVFYQRSVLEVAEDCIGKLLVHHSGEGLLVGRILEAEAYAGPEDRAAHSYGGRRTARTEAMFGPGGKVYMFFVYGMHWQLNLVTGEIDQPEAVLVRAIEPLFGISVMAQRRNRDPRSPDLTNGPGKLCQALGLGKQHYGHDLSREPLFLAEGQRGKIATSTRIGVDYAGDWAARPWRFFEADNPYVSRGPRDTLRGP